MTHTRDFEDLLELENVIGVEYDETNDRIVAFVTEKVPESELDSNHVIQRNVDRDSDVEAIGEIGPLGGGPVPDAQGARKNRHRPVEGGVSEANANVSAGTAGMYPVEVVDTSVGEWAVSVSEGDRVRLSNNHVYARSNAAELGESILQPSPYDGGTAEDAVGEVVGYVPLGDGASVDVAARSVDSDRESDEYHDLGGRYPTSVRRSGLGDLKGDTVVKTGRTTGVSTGEVKATSASVRVQYGDDLGAVTLRDLVVTSDISDGGDSGSPVFLKASGELLGEVFAGSDSVSVLCKAANVESNLGVKFVTGTDDDQYVESFDTTVGVQMEQHDLSLEELSGDKPKAGETIDASATVSGNYDGKCWLEVQGDRYTFELTASEGGGRYTADVAVSVTAPDEYRGSFDVRIAGGYVEQS
ncbi:S46 family peptidase [Halorussus sp. MSC15.2]|uniref:S46 family peptidase n=1 Tax=Halorussus sp. MSC15.2 TaxID=2283638 RepID=UPI0013D5ED2F|nr:S46 family peptidase [Halorussus sp. MSC15.2]NEU58617.1 S46 family peptidase [Halorussus sp. MSC15.2]